MSENDRPPGAEIVPLESGKRRRRRPSSVDLLPKDIRDELNDAIAEGRFSVDALWGLVKDKGGEVSRSAVGRHKVQEERALAEVLHTQRVASGFMREASKDPNGSASKLITQLVQSATFRRMTSMTTAQIEKLDPKDLNFFASVAKSVAQADKMTAEREAAIRDRAVKSERQKQEKALSSAERKGDIDKEAAQRAREILGFA